MGATWLPAVARKETGQRLILICIITSLFLGAFLLIAGGSSQLGTFDLQVLLKSSSAPHGLSESEEGNADHALASLRAQSWSSAFYRAKLLETVGYLDEAERPTRRCYRNRTRGEFAIRAEGLRGRNVSTFAPLSFRIQDEVPPSLGRRGLGGKFFYVSVEGSSSAEPYTVIRMPHPLVVDHDNGSYSVAFEVYDENVTYNVTILLWYAGHAGYLGDLRDMRWTQHCPTLPQMTFLHSFTFFASLSAPERVNQTAAPNSGLNKALRSLSLEAIPQLLGKIPLLRTQRNRSEPVSVAVPAQPDAARDRRPASSKAASEPLLSDPFQRCFSDPRGRWLNNSWEPADCPYTHFTAESLTKCAETNGPVHIMVVGDSLMRGLFFDMRQLLSGQEPDQRKAAHHDEEPVEELPGFTLEFKWTPQAFELLPRLQRGDFYGNTSTVLVFNTLQWDLRDPRRVDEYLSDTRRFLDGLVEARGRFRKIIWRSGASIHRFGPSSCEANCSSDDFINGPRGDLYNSAVRFVVEATPGVDILDMWQISSGRPDLQRNFHWDTRYIRHATVSKTVGNVLFNMLCG